MNFIVVVLICITVCDCFVSNRKYYDIVTQLPEVIINNKPKNEFNGYQYPVPVFPPIFLDETTTKLYPTHEPPTFDFPQVNITNDFPDYPAYLPPTITLQPPFFNPPPASDDDTVVISAPPTNEYLPPLNENIPPFSDYLPSFKFSNSHLNTAQVKVLNMSCLNSPNQRYFRAIIRMPHRSDLVPVLDDAATDCLIGSTNVYRLDFTEERMKRCGVKYCSNKDQVNMCIGIRIPTVRGLRMLEDMSLTLQCKPQERIVSHVKHLRFNAQSIQGRSAANIARGGYQPNFETQVELYRRSNDGTNKFTRLVNSGTVVQLGEELLLRAAVRDGDGWKYARLGEVIVHHVPKFNKADSRSVILVDNSGCRDVRMRSVCPDNPIQQNPLVTTLTVKAFMFQGMDNSDEMIMSVRMIGCLLQEDCFKGRSCEENITRNRVRRSISSNITNWQSFLEFKVAVPELESRMANTDAFTDPIFIIIFIVLVLLTLGISLLIYYKLIK